MAARIAPSHLAGRSPEEPATPIPVSPGGPVRRTSSRRPLARIAAAIPRPTPVPHLPQEADHPATRAIPFPKVTELICRLPLPTLFYRLEAANLGDLLRIWVRPSGKLFEWCLSLRFSRAVRGAPDGAKVAPLCRPSPRFSAQRDSARLCDARRASAPRRRSFY